MDSKEELHWLEQHRLQTASDDLSGSPGRVRRRAAELARRDQDCLRRLNVRLLVLGSPEYPKLLQQIHDPPPFLYARGRLELLQKPMFAIVGSRKCSGTSRRAAREFAAGMVEAGLAVCSGLALGVDSEAHRGALLAGGETVAVLGTGIDRIYPYRHTDLAGEIVERGLLLSELNPGAAPLPHHFPQRNRLISGLSLGVLIVEAAQRSGSLVTARMAMEQNRDVFALPHSIYDPGGRGCHALIRDGVVLVESPADILAEVDWDLPLAAATAGSLSSAVRPQSAASPAVPDRLAPLLEHVGFEPCSADELAARTGLDVAAVMAALVELEMLGVLENRDGLYRKC